MLTRRSILAFAAAGMTPALLRTAAAARPVLASAGALAFDGAALLLAAHDLWRSDDGGQTWAAVGSPGPLTVLSAHPSRPGVIYGAHEAEGVSRSLDGGRTWTTAASGLPREPVDALAIAAHAPDILYAAVRSDGLWRSRDAGDSWEFVMDRPYAGGSEHDVLSLVSVNNATGMGGIWLYAGTTTGLTRVPDCFCRWQDVIPGDAMDALVAGTVPVSPQSLPPGEPVRSLAVAPFAPEVIYAGSPSGVWKSIDAGVNWVRVAEGEVHQIALDPTRPGHVAAIGGGGIRISRDSGSTWNLLTIVEGE